MSDATSLSTVWPPNTYRNPPNEGEEGLQDGDGKPSSHDPVYSRPQVYDKDNPSLGGKCKVNRRSRHKRSNCTAIRKHGFEPNSSGDGERDASSTMEDEDGGGPCGDVFHSTTLSLGKIPRNRRGTFRGVKKKNQSHNATNGIFQKNKLVVKCQHRKYRYLNSRKRMKRRSKSFCIKGSGQIHTLHFSLCSLNRNTNAQHSDTDLMDEGNREKKPENMSSASGASVVSADIFYSTKTDMVDECETNPSFIELVGKSLADNEPHGPDKVIKRESPQVNADPNSTMVDFGNFGDTDTKTQSDKLNTAKTDDLKIQYSISGRKSGEDTQGLLLSKSPEEEGRQNKKTHKMPYACLFPSKASADKNVDGIDSVVLDCMRNALNDEIARMEKKDSPSKPPSLPENHHRNAGHRNRGSQDGGAAKSKPHGVKKGCLRSNKEEPAVGNEEYPSNRSSMHLISKSAIVKMDYSKENTSHRNMKSTSISAPNLPSVIDVLHQSPISNSLFKGERTSPKEGVLLQMKQSQMSGSEAKPDTVSVPVSRDMKSTSNRKHDKAHPANRRAASNERHAATVERTVEVYSDVGNVADVGTVLSTNKLLTDSETLTLSRRDVTGDELPSATKTVVKFKEQRGRSPKKKSSDIARLKGELASILSNPKDGERSSDADAKTLVKEGENVKGKKSLHKLKKSMSLSPQGTSRSKREVLLVENHQSDSQGIIVDFTEKVKPKQAKKSAKKKRVRIAPVHDYSPVQRSRKPQSISPVQQGSRNVPPSNLKPKSSPASAEERDNQVKKGLKKMSKKSVSAPKACPEDTEEEVREVRDTEHETNVHDCIYVPQASYILDDDMRSLVEEKSDEPSPVHVSHSQTDVSEKPNNVKVAVAKVAKSRKPEKDLQNAETGWNSSVVQNAQKPPVERVKSAKSKNYRKMYKLVKHSKKTKKGKEDGEVKGEAETLPQPLADNGTCSSELSKSEIGEEYKSSESVVSVTKENAVPQPKKAFGKKEHKSKDGQHSTDGLAKNHFSRRPNQSPRFNQAKQLRTHASATSDLDALNVEQSNFGSSVDKLEVDVGSSVDAPSFARKDLSLRQTRSGPALGTGKFAQKEMDNAAKRVKFARENAMNLAKQTRKNLVNSSSPVSVNQTDTSPVKNDPTKFGQRANEEQMSPLPSMSTDLDVAAGFKRPRLSPLGSRYRRDHKVLRPMPKLDVKVEECRCASANVKNQSPHLLPNCDNSVDYNVLNLGLNWVVQGVINRMPFLRTREHDCPGTTAAGDTTNPQALSSAAGLNR